MIKHSISHQTISESIDSKQRLTENEERLQAIMQHVSEAIIVIDQQGLIVDFNQKATQLFGYQRAEIIGSNVSRLMPSPHSDNHDKYLENYRQTGISKLKSKPRKFSGLHQQGYEFPIEVKVNPVGNLPLWVGIVRDLSEKRALQKAISEIDTLSQEKIGIELHDGIGQRLTGINLLLQNLKRELSKTNNPQNEILEEIRQQMSEAIGEVRDISHGLAPIALTPSALPVALNALVESINSLDISCQFYNTVTRPVKDKTVAVQLYRIVQEAINNALKNAAASRIILTFEDHGTKFRLSVCDNGKGFQIKQKSDKSGIGLQIMQHRADCIDAMLSIESSPGKGTTVSCVF